jgi:hypothetical protein
MPPPGSSFVLILLLVSDLLEQFQLLFQKDIKTT